MKGSINFEDKLKNQLIDEVEKITKYSKPVLDYMKDKNNWIMVDPDGAIGGSFLLYPMEVIALSTKNMTKEIMEELSISEPKLIEEELTEKEKEEFYKKEEEECIDFEDLVANGLNSIFAGFYWEDEEGEAISTLELEVRKDNGNYLENEVNFGGVFSELEIDHDKVLQEDLDLDLDLDFDEVEDEEIGEATFVFIFNGYEVEEEEIESAECLNSNFASDYLN